MDVRRACIGKEPSTWGREWLKGEFDEEEFPLKGWPFPSVSGGAERESRLI